MKIVHVVPALTKGGAEKVLVDLANHMAGQGHEVAIVAAFPVDRALLADQIDPKVELLLIADRPSKLRAYGGLPFWLLKHRKWLMSRDVVHCHLTYAALFGSALRILRGLSRKGGPRIVETFHGVGMPIKGWQRRLSASLAKRRDGFALMAEDDYWAAFAARNSRLPVAIIPNGIPTGLPAPSAAAVEAYRAEAGIPAGAKVIGTVGRLRAERNPIAMVAAFAAAAKVVPEDTRFLIAGDGPMTEAVREEGDRVGLGERLLLPGLALKPLVTIAAIDVYLSINVGPITGIAGLEAAAAGKPVIALQALPEHQLTEADWIWSSADPEKVGAEAARLLANPAEAAALGERQRAHVEARHSVGAMAKAYEELYARAGAKTGSADAGE